MPFCADQRPLVVDCEDQLLVDRAFVWIVDELAVEELVQLSEVGPAFTVAAEPRVPGDRLQSAAGLRRRRIDAEQLRVDLVTRSRRVLEEKLASLLVELLP